MNRQSLGLLLLAAFCGATMPVHADEPPAPKRPAYQGLRFNENWSVLPRVESDDFWDPVKYILLSDDGDIRLSFGGSQRTRVEVWSGFNFGAGPPGSRDNDTFLLNRTLAHADLHIGPHLRFFVEGKSSLGTDRDLPGGKRTLDVDELDLQNGFADLMADVLDGRVKLTFRAGRHELLFGKQRLVSPLDWSNTRRTFDGFSLIVTFDDWKITGFWTKPVVIGKYDFNYADSDDEFFGIYAAGKIPTTNIGLDLYWLGLENEAAAFNGTAGIERRHTLGGRLYGKIADTGFDYDLEGAWQTGTLGPGDIDAFMLATQLGYKFADFFGTPRVWIGFDYATGDESPGGDVETFNQLFPLGHAYLGWIDQIGRQNIIAINPGVQFAVNPKLDFTASAHFFWLAEDTDAAYNVGGTPYRGPVPGADTYIGTEIDLLLTYRFDIHTTVLVGYSHLFPGDFINSTGPHDDIDFFYASVQYTF